ncbi:hypothetical protein FZW96_13835 [Bacillus sp. BGMRC 2118]|nr:hypothetical protein FZW96_13835 [Bacillus sp. BGMRC 2118]
MGKSVVWISLCVVLLIAGCSTSSTGKEGNKSKVLVTNSVVPDTTTGTPKEKYTVENLENMENFLIEKSDKLEVRHDSLQGTVINNILLMRVEDGTYEITFDGFRKFPKGTHKCQEVNVYGLGLMVNKCIINGESVYETDIIRLPTNDIMKYGRLLKLHNDK